MKWRLLAAFAGLITVILLAQDLPLVGYLRKIEFERVIAGLERDAFLIAGNAEDVLANEPPETESRLQSTTCRRRSTRTSAAEGGRVVVVDANGALVVSSDPKDERGDAVRHRLRPR